jgi:hypothetical protein
MNKRQLKKDLYRATKCNVQHNGWPCGTCFFAMSYKLENEDWQALLLYRGDYKKEDLDNLPVKPRQSLEKINNIVQYIISRPVG